MCNEVSGIVANPFVSIIVPISNEQDYLLNCLQSLLQQDYPKDRYEIIVIVNNSEDKSFFMVQQLCRESSSLRCFEISHGGSTAQALNFGISNSRGEIIARMDAHAIAQRSYVSICVKYLLQKKGEHVGGVLTAVGIGYWGTIVSLVTSHPFGVGDSKHRCRRTEGCDEAGWPGAFWKTTLLELGGYDESLPCNEDDDLNFRLLKAGKTLFRTPEIDTRYFCRRTLNALFFQYFRYGFYKPRVLWRYGKITNLRHFIPSCFLLSLGGPLVLYTFSHVPILVSIITLSMYLCLQVFHSIALSRRKGWRYCPFLPIGFMFLHVSYGLGFLCGISRINGFPKGNSKSS